MENFLENFCDIILSPDEGMSRIKNAKGLTSAVFAVCFVSIFLFLIKYNYDSFNFLVFLLSGTFVILCALIFWSLFCLFIDAIFRICTKESKLHQLLNVVAYAGLPWIFMVPAGLFKLAGGAGYAIAVILQLIIAIYVLVLYIKAVANVYDLSFLKALALVSIPLAGSFFAVAWTIGFFTKMIYIFSV